MCFCIPVLFPKDHFEQSQFEEIARSPAGGKKLKPNAIPTLFSIGDPPYPAVTIPYILLPMKPEPGKCAKKRDENISSFDPKLNRKYAAKQCQSMYAC